MVRDVAEEGRFERLSDLLDHDVPPWLPDIVPALGHWLCFPPSIRQSRLGPDGHPAPTGDAELPPTGLPRRMWAGSRIRFLDDIPLDAPIQRSTRTVSQEHKVGRSGRMLFVTLAHEISVPTRAPAIIEEQDLVYREPASLSQQVTPVADIAGETADGPGRIVIADPVMLFRFSALTFNAHRIHYDRNYAQRAEGYSGLVVHGPLIATLLLDTFLREQPRRRVRQFSFRARSPIFDGEPIHLVRQGQKLAAIGPRGVAMTAECELDG